MSASPLLSSMLSAAAAAASPAAAIVPAALLLCFWLARRPASCSSALASCARRLIMMRSPLCAACPARQCSLPPRSGGLCWRVLIIFRTFTPHFPLILSQYSEKLAADMARFCVRHDGAFGLPGLPRHSTVLQTLFFGPGRPLAPPWRLRGRYNPGQIIAPPKALWWSSSSKSTGWSSRVTSK